MTKVRTGLICLLLCLTLTVLTGGGWAEELLAPKCFGDRCYEMSSLRDPPDGNWSCWDVSLGAYVYGELTEQCDYVSSITVDSSLTITAPSFDEGEVYATLLNENDYGKYDKLSIGKIDFCKQICFKLKGDDVERCVRAEWLYELLKMMQP